MSKYLRFVFPGIHFYASVHYGRRLNATFSYTAFSLTFLVLLAEPNMMLEFSLRMDYNSITDFDALEANLKQQVSDFVQFFLRFMVARGGGLLPCFWLIDSGCIRVTSVEGGCYLFFDWSILDLAFLRILGCAVKSLTHS